MERHGEYEIEIIFCRHEGGYWFAEVFYASGPCALITDAYAEEEEARAAALDWINSQAF